jgi:hypothetical protein
MDFPSNRREPGPSESDKPEKEPVQKIVEGKVIQRKKTLTSRLRGIFSGMDVRASIADAIEYAVKDVMIPAAQDMFFDTLTQGLERAIRGDDARSSGRRTVGSRYGGSVGRVRYNEYSATRRDEDARPSSLSRRARANHEFDEIILPSRGDAIRVISKMQDMIDQYNAVTVGDLYSMVDIDGTHADEKWGWTDLVDAIPRRVSNGFLLDLPRPEPLKIR